MYFLNIRIKITIIFTIGMLDIHKMQMKGRLSCINYVCIKSMKVSTIMHGLYMYKVSNVMPVSGS